MNEIGTQIESAQADSWREGFISGNGGPDLLRWPLLRRLLLWRGYPLAFQLVAGAVFLMVIGHGLWGPPMGDDNFAVALTWRLWWVLLPFSFVFFGRLWCGVCPMGSAGELVQRLRPGEGMEPGPWLRKYGPWAMVGLFLSLFWIGMVWHICCWPRSTAVVLLGLLVASMGISAAYRQRTWCRYLCPLGIFAGLFSMLAMVGLRARKEVCLQDCQAGRRGILPQERQDCPFLELPMAMDTNRYCNLCAKCVKDCSLASWGLMVRRPGEELWRLKRPLLAEAFMSIALVAVALIEVVNSTPLFAEYMRWTSSILLLEYDAIFSLSLIGVIAVTLGIYLGASWIFPRSEGASLKGNLIAFGYGYLPIALAGYLAVGILRLAKQGERAALVVLNGVIPIFELPPMVRAPIYTVDLPVKVLQYLVLALGVWGTLYALRHIARRRGEALPAGYLAFALLIASTLAYLLYLPAAVVLH